MNCVYVTTQLILNVNVLSPLFFRQNLNLKYLTVNSWKGVIGVQNKTDNVSVNILLF